MHFIGRTHKAQQVILFLPYKSFVIPLAPERNVYFVYELWSSRFVYNFIQRAVQKFWHDQ